MNDEPDRTARHPVGSPAFFEALVDLAVSPFVVIDDDLVLHYASSSVTTMLGWRPDEWVGRNASELLTEESLGVVALGLHDLDEAPNDPDWVAAPVRMFIKHADGTIVPIDATARPPERTGVDGIVVQLHRAGATQAMSDAVDAILDGTDLEGALSKLASLIEHDIGNSSAVLASDWDRRRFAQIAGTNTLLTLHQPRPRDRAAIQMALDSGDAVTELFSHLDPATQSEAIAAGLHTCWCAPVPPFDHNEPTAALFVWHVGQDPPGPIYTSDISRSVNLARLALRWMGQQRLLAWDAAHDHLTGLINRSEFQNQLDASAGRARAVLYFDLDDFKPVNDTFGHRVGDQVLAAVAGRLLRVAGSHLVARLGGDEFALLIDPLTDLGEPAEIAEAARRALTQPISVATRLANVGVCVGVAIDPAGIASADHLLDEADRCLRECKRLGKNQVCTVTLPTGDRTGRDESGEGGI